MASFQHHVPTIPPGQRSPHTHTLSTTQSPAAGHLTDGTRLTLIKLLELLQLLSVQNILRLTCSNASSRLARIDWRQVCECERLGHWAGRKCQFPLHQVQRAFGPTTLHGRVFGGRWEMVCNWASTIWRMARFVHREHTPCAGWWTLLIATGVGDLMQH